jgi:hypothetical protein
MEIAKLKLTATAEKKRNDSKNRICYVPQVAFFTIVV